MRLTLFIYTLCFASLTALLHVAALKFSLYWIFPWSDYITHGLGGMTSALLLAGLLHPLVSRKYFYLSMLILVLGVGIAWELFEYAAGLARYESPYWVDTGSDLIFDVIGAFLGSRIAHRILQKSYAVSEQ